MSSKRPSPVNEEIAWDKTKTIKSKTDDVGTIDYVNSTFVEVSEYTKEELIGQPHNILRHPDMPKVIFKLLWENLKKGTNFNAIVKNMTKTGKYYWIVTNFDIFKDSSGTPSSFMGVRTSIPDGVISEVTPLYEELLAIEKEKGIEDSETYLQKFLEGNGGDYISFVKNIMQKNGVDVGNW